MRPAAARDRNWEHVTLTDPTMVAGTILEPGTYKLVWEGPGPQVQVAFEKGLQTVLTTTAQLIPEGGPFDGAVVVRTREDNTRILQRITWNRKSLIFGATS